MTGNRMTAGFALIGWPVRYGETGVLSFITSSDGTVYERDLGLRTSHMAGAVKAFNPAAGWQPTPP